jgi:hypothetical protein
VASASPATSARGAYQRGANVLPGAAGGVARASDDLEPRGLAEAGVLAAVIGRPEHAVGEVGGREVRDRVAARLDGAAAQLGAHAAPQRLGVQHALRHSGHQELPIGVAA